MFTIYQDNKITFLPDHAIREMVYNKDEQTVDLITAGGHRRLYNVDAVNYSSPSMPLTLKYKN